ncbi:spore germination protein [Paenibacillus physcomitrellae]|uniref:Spore germination protein n=1 Tax=Paenibacillus physcomitrellae TaxID=1619311 RepID=A0ABQ1FXZ4_9BACL|nr:spore germination protein [Paenibacillus physcomitrellae]GGA32868.1 hypothetical protein GCM10010917_17420 [Paenibacillus physcomitrellae]
MSWFKNKNNDGKHEPDRDQEQKRQQDHELVQELIQELVQELAQEQDQGLGQEQIFDLDQDLDGNRVQGRSEVRVQAQGQAQGEDQRPEQLRNREEQWTDQQPDKGEDDLNRKWGRSQDHKEELSREFDGQNRGQEEVSDPGNHTNQPQTEGTDPSQTESTDPSQTEGADPSQSEGIDPSQSIGGGDDEDEGQGESEDQKGEDDKSLGRGEDKGRGKAKSGGQDQSQGLDDQQEKEQKQNQSESESEGQSEDRNQDQEENQGEDQNRNQGENQGEAPDQDKDSEQNKDPDENQTSGEDQSREGSQNGPKDQDPNNKNGQNDPIDQNSQNNQDNQDEQYSASASKSDSGEGSGRSNSDSSDSSSSKKKSKNSGSSGEQEGEPPLGSDLQTNLTRLKKSLENCSDIIYRPFKLYSSGKDGVLIYLDGMCDSQQVEEAVLRPLMEGPDGGNGRTGRSSRSGPSDQSAQLDSSNRSHSSNYTPGSSEDQPSGDQKRTDLPEQYLVTALHTSRENKFKQILQNIMKGETAVLMDGESEVLIIDLIKMEQRSINEPTSEKVVRGPRDGFTESLRTNTSLIRRRIVSSRLKAEALSIGTFTRTNVAIMYIDGIAKESLIEEVKGRVKDIDVDGLLYSQDIEEYIEDSVFSPFPQVQNTERPDVAAASLLEGKVVIIVDNSPIVLIAPMTYWAGLQAADDYTERPMYASLVRWLRYIFVHISLLLPSLYVALTTFHPEVIPTPLLISIASAREGVPFPAMIEALLMEIIFEGLREAGIRLPQQVGPAVSIAGALVIGQAVVDAGIVSSPMVIIVSLTGIASFAFPMYNIGASFRMLRFPLLLISGFIGFYGVMLFLILMTVHLVSLKPFGIPYMAPASPLESSNLRDILIRAPKWKMNKRMGTLSGQNRRRSPQK